MKNLLIIGINTRSLVSSGLKLNYNIFTTSYFKTSDFPDIKNCKGILNEQKHQSNGSFEEDYSSKKLLKESEEYLEIADYIILQSGICESDFKGNYSKYKDKILGNVDTKDIEDKFKFYKKIKDNYLTPKTFFIRNDVDEAIEITKNYPNKQFILKPSEGSGGYNTNLLNNDSLNQLNNSENSWILQEYISGINLSSTTLSTGTKSRHLLNSRLLTANDFGYKNNFLYIGNILPLTEKIHPEADKLNLKMKKISESLMNDFKLIGSNGVDFIANENGLYVIELNPRIQGTYECCEKVLSINMLDAHIKACQGILIDKPNIDGYSYKKIIYAKNRHEFKTLPFKNIYDMPNNGAITEIGEPLLTIVDKNRDLEKLIEDVESTSKKIQLNAQYIK